MFTFLAKNRATIYVYTGIERCMKPLKNTKNMKIIQHHCMQQSFNLWLQVEDRLHITESIHGVRYRMANGGLTPHPKLVGEDPEPWLYFFGTILDICWYPFLLMGFSWISTHVGIYILLFFQRSIPNIDSNELNEFKTRPTACGWIGSCLKFWRRRSENPNISIHGVYNILWPLSGNDRGVAHAASLRWSESIRLCGCLRWTLCLGGPWFQRRGHLGQFLKASARRMKHDETWKPKLAKWTTWPILNQSCWSWSSLAMDWSQWIMPYLD